jgi:starch phosphorylase
MTNGITPRRWLNQANPLLSELISSRIGTGWIKNLDELKRLIPLAEEPKFRKRFAAVKLANKQHFADEMMRTLGEEVRVDSLFDVQIKRMHEYKRQLLNVLHVVTLYKRICDAPESDAVPRTVIISGKAAPAYYVAKLIIKLINDVAAIVNHDPRVKGRLKLLFVPNYGVSVAEKLIPAADLSEQISTAGTEASGTGNMKLALNGALTIGTMDGANIEIHNEVGADNIFIFGLSTDEVANLRTSGYRPLDYYHGDSELSQVLDMIGNGYFSPEEPARFKPIVDNLLEHGDHYLLLADYASYIQAQRAVEAAYCDQEEWLRKAILNVANMGKFSSDRTILQYAQQIWHTKPVT